MWVVDTNTLIYFFKGEGHVAKHMLAKAPSEIGLPSVVFFELNVGIRKSSAPQKRAEQLAEFARAVRFLAFGVAEAQCAADLRVALERKGKPIGLYDTLIAGIALAHGATLVTRNTREFKRVPGLRVEDWYV